MRETYPGKLHTQTIYLCGGINALSDADCRDWREAVKERMTHGYNFLDPMRRDYRGREAECVEEIVKGDLLDINNSDIILVNASKPSWGTAMEAFYAFQHGLTVVVFCPSDKPSPWLVYYSDFIVKTWEEVFELLETWIV